MTSSRSKLVLNMPQKSRSEIEGCLSAFSSQNCTLTKNPKRKKHSLSLTGIADYLTPFGP